MVASQVEYHAEWGGTVPDIARRKHQEWLEPVIHKALLRAGINPKQADTSIQAVAVTYGPGLAPSLEVGLDHAKAWAKRMRVPLIPVNHLEAHLLSGLVLNRNGNGVDEQVISWPALGFVISGGHTELVLMRSIGDYVLLGETLDDAAGEAYDKVARMLQLGYPGGPILAEMAKVGTPRFTLPIPMLDRKDLHFSFSGLKTAAKNALAKLEYEKKDQRFIADFAASFEHSVKEHLMRRLKRAIELHQPKTLFLGGGVVSNVFLRQEARKVAKKYGVGVLIPTSQRLFTDNAGMIGVAGYYIWTQKRVMPNAFEVQRQPNLQFPKETI
jgi:N6-L-threonylcarbamoyladenine synthase